ncbi:MAG: ATP synthase F1 subunit gamma [Candidatus Amulumruptor caecigallinarius]|nr:ATP synthase F1 subunit gamma [Candidatus Amulumruptor caecigallinarius]
MATLRELKTRIGSVASTEKITGAMKMISSAKVHQSEQSLRKLQPFKDKIKSIMGHILSTDMNFNSSLIEAREVKRAAVVVFGSDDGLCGAYNINILKGFLIKIDELRNTHGSDIDIDVYPVGKKMLKAVKRLSDPHMHVITMEGVDSKMLGEKVNEFTKILRDRFIRGDVDIVEVVYMRYYSMSKQRLTEDQLFPVVEEQLRDGLPDISDNQLYIFEPDANSIFNEVLPMFVLSMMQEITIENRSSEQAARVMAMQSANDNAKDLLEQLQLEYNKLRQQNITTELLDILGGQVER